MVPVQLHEPFDEAGGDSFPRPVVGQRCNHKEDQPPVASMTGGHRAANPPNSRSVSIQVPLPVLAVFGDVRQAFHRLCISTGMQALQAMQEADRDVLCGPSGVTTSSGRRGAAGAWRVT